MHTARTPYFWDLDTDIQETEDNVKPIKVFVIGENKTGKSSLIQRIVNNSFTLSYTETKAVEIYRMKTIADIQYQFVDIPPNTASFPANVKASAGDAVILMMSGNSTTEFSNQIWDKFFKRLACNLWIVYNSIYREVPPNNQWFQVDLLANAGVVELLYSIQHKLRPLY